MSIMVTSLVLVNHNKVSLLETLKEMFSPHLHTHTHTHTAPVSQWLTTHLAKSGFNPVQVAKDYPLKGSG